MTIRRQLRSLAFIGICGLLIFGAVACAALFQIQVNGPLYRTISLNNDLIADYVPPSQSLLQPALICAKLTAAPDQESSLRYAERIKAFQREFDRDYADYMLRVPEGKLKSMMRGQAHETAQEYFRFADQLIVLVNQGRVDEARMLLVSTMNPLYDRHAAAVDQIVILARHEARATEALAARSVRLFTAAMVGIGLLVLMAVGALSWVIARGIATQADKLILSEQSRSQQAQLLQSVLTSMAEGVAAVDDHGKIRVWNAETERLFGPSPLESDWGSWTASMGIYLADGITLCPPGRLPLLQAMRGQESHAELLVKSPRHETSLWLEVNARPVRDAAGAITGGVVVFRDTTERKLDLAERQQRERDLRQTNRALRILSSCNASIVHAETESALLHEVCSILVAQASYQLAVVGYTDPAAPHSIHPETSVSEASTITIEDSGALNDLGRAIRDAMSAAVRSGCPDLRAASARASGSLLSVPLIGMGKVFGALSVWSGESDAIDSKERKLIEDVAAGLARDILALRLTQERIEMVAALEQTKEGLEQRVEHRTVELVAAKEAAESADRIKSAFLATMSHELRTPLNSIIGFTGVILQELAGPLNAEQKKQLGMVQISSRHLLALITDVLDISKIEAGQLTLGSESFNVLQSVEKVVRSVQPQAEAKGLQLRSALEPNVTTVTGDHRRIEQVLLNLLSNAIKFTDSGEVSINCTVEDGWFAARVCDTGIGIAASDLVHLFRPFHQIDTGLARKYEGSGLGLSICRKLAEMMGGTISAESVPDQGSTFTFRFPVGGPE
jgi:signal transduction histidine kinase/PAS domain-containing protein